jgi:hypothetical protein
MSADQEEPLGSVIGFLINSYFLIGMGYGEWVAYREMGCVAFMMPFTHFYAIYYAFTWPYYFFVLGDTPPGV